MNIEEAQKELDGIINDIGKHYIMYETNKSGVDFIDPYSSVMRTIPIKTITQFGIKEEGALCEASNTLKDAVEKFKYYIYKKSGLFSASAMMSDSRVMYIRRYPTIESQDGQWLITMRLQTAQAIITN